MAKRASLKDRRMNDQKGFDAIFEDTTEEKHETKKKATENKESLVKATFYLAVDQITTLEMIQLNQRKETGSKPDKSSLVREALDLLAEKYKLPV